MTWHNAPNCVRFWLVCIVALSACDGSADMTADSGPRSDSATIPHEDGGDPVVPPDGGESGDSGMTGDGAAADASPDAPEPPPAAGAFFSDTFASGDLSHADEGARWGGGSDTSVTSDFGYADSTSLRFTFGPDPSEENSRAEQRFALGRPVDELWIEMRMHYPDGTEAHGGGRYYHRDDVGADNNKFLRLWHGDYAGAQPKLGYSTRPTADGSGAGSSDGNSRLFSEISPVGESMGSHDSQTRTFVSDDDPGTCRRGRWCRVRIHARLATAANDDGVLELWVDGTLLLEDLDRASYGPSEAENYVDVGYLLGAANTGFLELTYVHIDDVHFHDVDPGW